MNPERLNLGIKQVRICKKAIEVDSTYFAVYAQMAILQQVHFEAR